MLYQNIDIHNAAELHEVEGTPGVQPRRVPESTRLTLNEGSQQRMTAPANVELRFVSDRPVDITLSSPEAQARCVIYQGDFRMEHGILLSPEPRTIRLERHPRIGQLIDRLAQIERGEGITPRFRPQPCFAPQVTRLLIAGEGPLHIHRIEPQGDIRPPRADELPARRMLAYGTSITQGYCASNGDLNYAAQCARHLGADLINLGSSGSAHCEHTLADYIASRDDWDFATLALSVNMGFFEQAEFRKRVGYMVDTVAGADTSRPVFAITLWPFIEDLGMIGDETKAPTPENTTAHAERMRQDLRDAVAACTHPNLHLLEGPELFGPFIGHTVDFVHPADHAMIEMGRNLADAIRPHLRG